MGVRCFLAFMLFAPDNLASKSKYLQNCQRDKKHQKASDSQVLKVGSVVEWLKRRAYDQHCLSSKPTRAILLCPWERHFTALSPAWWSWQAVLNYSHISIKLHILATAKVGRGNCILYVLAPPSLSSESPE